jgi:Flp pilus assembly protein TadG
MSRQAIWSEEGGGTAVEMALIAPLFLLLVFAAVELGLMLFVNAALDGATREAARAIRTGEAQLSGGALAAVRSRLCAQTGTLIDCNAVALDARVFGSFAAVSLPPLTAQPGAPATVFNPGDAGQIVVLRAVYRYEFMLPMVAALLGDGGGDWLLATAIFRNEPFRGGTP